ncbi:3'(2'),5'-bisphosphate nucleotidase CysQ [Shewanella sp. 202IG2-18]|uniref:3'(2'),5'-bisphosphate nucleotidase CysQ n=1 Tax=Parashewanella hymeniacidonis TaxID=2807618 RepID=UPI001960556B|nr:3'(2'),5'-bisphosphate nucleotidase CysQ [Parashewanella hymeniacidonis]MBM7071971.1 3'(2'),5'-bisphosphate nucleotidase CysQ [Parashewanella hymeniacidonis]
MLTLEQLKQVCEIAVDAGNAIMAYYQHDDVAISIKTDETPVTAADLAAHRVIVEGLNKLPFRFPVLSEESELIAWDERKDWEQYWLIDPLDGTKEFINKNGEFTVNIALIHHGKPIAGVVYAPALKRCFYGIETLGAWCDENGETVALPDSNLSPSKLTIVGSRSHQSPEMSGYLMQFNDYEVASVGSSLKFCLLASGEAQLYPRLGPTSEWDTAAGQAVLIAAGGSVTLLNSSEPLLYNQKKNILNPLFLARSKNCSEYNMEQEV